MGIVLSQRVTVRRASLSDRGAVWLLAQDGPAPHAERRVAFDPDFAAMLSNEARGVLVAEVDGLVVGYVLVHRHRTLRPDAPVAWVEDLVVSVDHRGTGVGRALVGAAEEWATQAGCAHMAVATRGVSAFFDAAGYAATAGFHEKILI